ncbi:IS66 family transposase [Thauera aromatica]|uniref:Mobile element protein n=1 Tax=Thauera aromatica K172 TaxID=44139 RepID=A0A2R4BJ92_THAAR|nr:IS66 family transposase [Thauera aromatica]AVR87322.1 Mobile element protein [Thauera aromatica K172]
MTTPVFLTVPTLAEAARWAPEQVVELAQANAATQRQLDAMRLEFQAMKHQLDWFRRQLFGQKSEKRLFEADPHQMHLGELPVPESSPPPPGKDIAAHTRRARATDYARDDEPALFFDETRVPVETIALPNPDAEGLAPDQYEVIGEKTSFRLAQRPGSYVILKYVRPVIKHRDTQVMSCPAAPVGVIEGSRADVSFVAGLITDKFCYHQPLYRQHQRLGDNGIKVSRPWLTQLTHAALSLLEPVFVAQLDSIRASRVKAMDETPIKAGRAGPGKMKGGYFWPVYGERDEICFPYHEGRGGKHIAQTLGTDPPPKGAVLLTDGYGAYERYAEKCGLTHAQCWAHSRRKFFDAQSVEPERAGQALDMIGKLYAVEKHIREAKLVGEARRAHRLAQAKPVVHQFFAWVDAQFESQGLLPSSPSSPLTTAMAYVRERRAALEVYLADPEVPIDTNHLERALRVVPMGRRNWLFCWTEVGAKYVGIAQSLIATCRLHDIDPYAYLVDVLQRVGQHPAADVAQLTPRLWKQHFAANPLRSDLFAISK